MEELKIVTTVKNFEEIEQLFKRADELTRELGKIYWELRGMQRPEKTFEKE